MLPNYYEIFRDATENNLMAHISITYQATIEDHNLNQSQKRTRPITKHTPRKKAKQKLDHDFAIIDQITPLHQRLQQIERFLGITDPSQTTKQPSLHQRLQQIEQYLGITDANQTTHRLSLQQQLNSLTNKLSSLQQQLAILLQRQTPMPQSSFNFFPNPPPVPTSTRNQQETQDIEEWFKQNFS